MILSAIEGVCSHEENYSLPGIRVPSQIAFPHTGRAQTGARAKNIIIMYIDDQPLIRRLVFSRSNAGKALCKRSRECLLHRRGKRKRSKEPIRG